MKKKDLAPTGWKPDTELPGHWIKINITAVMYAWKKFRAWLKTKKEDKV
jgi:hypothetical protein